MAVKTAANPKRKSYANRVRALIISMFGLSKQDWIEQNKAWENWFRVENRDRNQHEVQALLKSDVKDVFKARVLAILFAPQAEYAPFVGGEHRKSDDELRSDKNTQLSALPPILRTFAIALIGIYTTSVSKHSSRYRTQILDALKILPQEDPAAAQLFKRYQLLGEQWGDCAPFGELLGSKIPEKWKRLADAKMRKQLPARKKTTCTDDIMLHHYAYRISACLDGKSFPYSDALLASQIEFLLKLPQAGRGFYVGPMKRILKLLAGDAHADLRHRFARRVLLDARGRFGQFEVNNASDRAFAVMLLKEFGGCDLELGTHLLFKIAEGDGRRRKQNAVTRKLRARDDAALAPMR